jgi:hypothetical protein
MKTSFIYISLALFGVTANFPVLAIGFGDLGKKLSSAASTAWTDTLKVVTDAAEATKGATLSAADKVAKLADIQSGLKSAIDFTGPFAKSTDGAGNDIVDDELLLKKIIFKLPSSALRIYEFELAPTILIDDVFVPLLAIIKEVESGTFQDSTQRMMNVLATTIIFSSETGLKTIKAGLFSVLPDPFSLAGDFMKMNTLVANQSATQESIMSEALKAIYIQVKKAVVADGPDMDLQTRMEMLTELRPVMMQVSEMISRRMDEATNLGDTDSFTKWINDKIDAYRLEEFGEIPL